MLFLPYQAPLCQVGWVVSRDTGEVRAVGCGRWLCVSCGPRRRRRYAARLYSRRWDRLITFTQPPLKGEATRENLRDQARAWRRVWQWARRRGMTDYAWVRELGARTGRLHLHVIVKSPFLPHRQLKRACVRNGFGSVVDVRKIRSKEAVRYVAKYLSKGTSAYPRYTRRVQTNVPAVRGSNQDWLFLHPWEWATVYPVSDVPAGADEIRFSRDHRGRQIELPLIPSRKTASRDWQDPGG